MKKIIKLLSLSFLTFILFTGNISAGRINTLTIRESTDPESQTNIIEDGTTLIGITKFEADTIITAGKVSTATYNDVVFNYGKEGYTGVDIYYFFLGDWYSIDNNNDATPLLENNTQQKAIIDKLNEADVYYVNNVEKILDVPWDFGDEGVEFTFKTDNPQKAEKVTISGDTLKVPATVRTLEVLFNEVGSEEKISLFNIAKENENDIGFEYDVKKGTINSDPANTGKTVSGLWWVDTLGNIMVLEGDIAWYPADTDLHRTEGNRVGVQITAPEGYTEAQVADAVVKMNGQTYRWADVKDGANYLLIYPLITQESETFEIEITWATGNTQVFTVVVEGYLEEPETITFNSNGGSSVNSINVKTGTPVAKPTNPTKTDNVFIEWQLNGAPYNFASNVVENIELVAVWEPVWFNTAKGLEAPIFNIDSTDKLNYLIANIDKVNALAATKEVKININEFVEGTPTIGTDITVAEGVELIINTPTVINSEITVNGTLINNAKITGTGKILLAGEVYNAGITAIDFKATSINSTIYTPWGEEWIAFAGGTANTTATFELLANSEFTLNEITPAEAARGAIDIEFTSGTITLKADHIITPNAKVTIGEAAEFVVAEGKTLYNYGTFTVNGTLTINGTIDDYNDVNKGNLKAIWAAANFTSADMPANRGLLGTGEINLNGALKVCVGVGGVELNVKVNTTEDGKFYIKAGDTTYEYIGSAGMARLSEGSSLTFETNESDGFKANVKTGTFTISSFNGMDPVNYPTSFFIGAVDEISIDSGATVVVDHYTVLNGKITGSGALVINEVIDGADLLIINDYETQNKLSSTLSISGTGTYERRNP